MFCLFGLTQLTNKVICFEIAAYKEMAFLNSAVKKTTPGIFCSLRSLSCLHGSYNLEKVLNFNSHLEKSFNLVKVLEKHLISLVGHEKSLIFSNLCTHLFIAFLIN